GAATSVSTTPTAPASGKALGGGDSSAAAGIAEEEDDDYDAEDDNNDEFDASATQDSQNPFSSLKWADRLADRNGPEDESSAALPHAEPAAPEEPAPAPVPVPEPEPEPIQAPAAPAPVSDPAPAPAITAPVPASATRPARSRRGTNAARYVPGVGFVSDDGTHSTSPQLAAAAAGATHWAWDEVLRRQWYTRRCLGLRQPFDSVHRLAKAEHDSAAPFPLLNDLRRVLVETRGCAVSVDGAAPEPADVLLCTDAIVVCATRQRQQDQNQPDQLDQRGRLHAVEFGDVLCVQLADGAAGRTVCITGGEDSLTQQQQQQRLVVEFPSSGSARAWMDQAMQARTRLDSALQDLRLDEEDYVDRPPLPLLARGRSSIAGTGAANVSLGPSTPLRMRNAAHGGVYWVPDGEAAACMVCRKTVFSMMVRRHHCRACGLVICYRCSAVAADASDSNDTDSARRRLCVRCWRQRKMHPMPPAASSSSALALALVPVDAPRHSPSLMTLGRRAAEYLPAGDIVMQLAAQHEAAAPPIPPVRKKPDRLARRPISSLFPLAAAAEPEPDASPAG
ncbi:hypothetical protein GGH99_003430, partial [Coemansia sp. RSA 1285]